MRPAPGLYVPGYPGLRLQELRASLAGHHVSLLAASTLDARELAPRSSGYWMAAWPAGLALAEHLIRHRLAGQRVLDLGCGVGLAGIAAALAGAEVLCVDREPGAVRLASINARRNGVGLRAVAADWDAWPLAGRWDLVLGADITYDPEEHAQLAGLLGDLLDAGSEALLADPGRESHTQFLSTLSTDRWQVRAVGPPAGASLRAAVFSLRRVSAT